MQNKYSLLFLFSLSSILLSCGTANYMVRYSPQPADTYTNGNLKSFLRTNNKVNIVLRVPNASEEVTTKSSGTSMIKNSAYDRAMDIYYNAIEKELLKAGFSVRDRGLFNEVLKKMQRDNKQNIDYSQIKELTETDVILEVIKIDPAVQYVTNKLSVQDKKGNWKEQTGYGDFKKYGASAEYKVILLKNNEMAGTYKFNYAPCPNGCELSAFNAKVKVNLKGLQPQAYEGVEVDKMEEFIKGSTRDLISAIKGM
jgi:hypothetical protein